MAPPSGTRTVVIGVGNDFRSDDRIGLVVARALRARLRDGLAVGEYTGDTAGLLEAWQGADAAILVDAVVTGAAAGTIHRFDLGDGALPRHCFPCSTHAFSIPEAVELARALHGLPPRVIIYGIEGENFEPGLQLSGAVEEAAPIVVRRILHEVGEAG